MRAQLSARTRRHDQGFRWFPHELMPTTQTQMENTGTNRYSRKYWESSLVQRKVGLALRNTSPCVYKCLPSCMSATACACLRPDRLPGNSFFHPILPDRDRIACSDTSAGIWSHWRGSAGWREVIGVEVVVFSWLSSAARVIRVGVRPGTSQIGEWIFAVVDIGGSWHGGIDRIKAVVRFVSDCLKNTAFQKKQKVFAQK